MIGIGVLASFSFLMSSLATMPTRFGREGFGMAIGALILLAVALLVGAVLALLALTGKLIPGVLSLAQIDHEFSTASSLISLGYKWGLILLLIGALTIVVLIGIFILFISAIFLLIGGIGLIILCFKLNDRFKNTLYLVAGILFIIGIFIGIASFVAWILLYVALGDTINRLRRQQQPLPYQPPL